MPSKLEILGQVMLSLKDDQNNVMNNINASLNNRDTEKDLISNIKASIGKLSLIHNAMQETESFIVQLTTVEAKKSLEEVDKPKNIGSSGTFNDKENKESEK